MKISFDLDETLFVNPQKIKVEPQLKFPFCYIYKERLRQGTPKIMKRIKEYGFELWIYTTSFRSISYIKKYFKHYGIKVDMVINGQSHQHDIQKNNQTILPSKMPSKYRINLHVDDEVSVKQYGDMYGYKVFLLKEENENWVEDLWDEILIQAKKQRRNG